eukprot:TRINITY_DN7258_c0_g2_i2.p1 TRINITY_DN7258_c0_g2~~TRINITY_DN7258_c0_g2_i2.p1  ORF type:complete len:371 (-),score=26.27 TRINITY_DN7258_c0_g2_i2:465-1577(-)
MLEQLANIFNSNYGSTQGLLSNGLDMSALLAQSQKVDYPVPVTDHANLSEWSRMGWNGLYPSTLSAFLAPPTISQQQQPFYTNMDQHNGCGLHSQLQYHNGSNVQLMKFPREVKRQMIHVHIAERIEKEYANQVVSNKQNSNGYIQSMQPSQLSSGYPVLSTANLLNQISASQAYLQNIQNGVNSNQEDFMLSEAQIAPPIFPQKFLPQGQSVYQNGGLQNSLLSQEMLGALCQAVQQQALHQNLLQNFQQNCQLNGSIYQMPNLNGWLNYCLGQQHSLQQEYDLLSGIPAQVIQQDTQGILRDYLQNLLINQLRTIQLQNGGLAMGGTVGALEREIQLAALHKAIYQNEGMAPTISMQKSRGLWDISQK